MDITDIKAENVKQILNHLRFSSGLTKRELADMTGLSFSTVSNLCNELKDSQVLNEEKSSGYAVGRTPNRLMFRREQYGSLCVDLHQEHILNFTVLDFSNRRLYQDCQNISSLTRVEQVVSLIGEQYRMLRTDPRFSGIQFIGLGVSVPAIYDPTTRNVVNSTFRLFDNVPLQDMLLQQIPLPCYVDNEANLCVLSMSQSHAERRNIVYLHSSSGLGVGVVCDGHLLQGDNGYAGEVAHIPLGDPQLRCPFCGNLGCIENDLSQRGMDILHFPALDEREKQRLLQDRGRKLGELLSILANLFDPAVIYLGGSALETYDTMLPYVMHALHQRSGMVLARGLSVLHDTDSLTTIAQGINQVIYEKWNPLEQKQ